MVLKRIGIMSVVTAGCLSAALMTGCHVRQSLELDSQTTTWVQVLQPADQTATGLAADDWLNAGAEETATDPAASADLTLAGQEPGVAVSTAAGGAYQAAVNPDLDSAAEASESSTDAAAQGSSDHAIESLAADFPVIYSLNHLGEVRVTVLDREVLLTYVNPPDDRSEPDHTGIGRYVSKKVYDESGALTLVLTPASYWEMLSALQDEILQQYNELIELGLTPASWQSLGTELEVGDVYITVDPATFVEGDKYDVPAIQTLASLYQLYNGVEPDSIQVTLVFQSQEDGSVLDVMDSAEEQQQETAVVSVDKGSVPASSLWQP
ncbi:hypothetical protein HCH52_04955 [Oscillospiraceae bacterium HV4-5-C5C]|nr:hypothetical protein [Oscillospiraceae bacterium HV4-5-C5C]